MRALLRNVLAQECEKHIDRLQEYLFELEEGTKRKSKRLGKPVAKTIKTPEYWDLDPGFNPFKTRSSKKLDLYSYTLAKKVREKNYAPKKAVKYYIPKEDGSKRELNIFQLPDAALSRLVYKSLLHKNINRLSAYAYAYREDKGAHDAVLEIFSEWKHLDRVYVAEFDFTKFFDNISHDFLWRAFNQNGFLCTPEEKVVIQSFLKSESVDAWNYATSAPEVRKQGIPQGTSVSLFLANLACWELDRALERLGVGFSRYADDTVIWSDTYQKVVQAYDSIKRHAALMAVPLNLDKSQGVSLVTRRPGAEIGSKRSIDYLGYRISLSHVSMKDSRVKATKKKIGYLVYQNLLQPLFQGVYNVARLKGVDWDYMVALSQVRRYLYGGLSDEKLRKYIRGEITRLNFRGLMSYYPLANDVAQLSDLDGWLIYVLK